MLAVKPSDGGDRKIISIAWEQNKGAIHVVEEAPKRGAVIVCRMIAKCEFEALPLYENRFLWME